MIFLALLVSLNWNGFSPSNNSTNNNSTPTQTPTTSPTSKSTNTNISVQVSGTVTTNEGVPTQITFEQMSTSGSLTGKVYSSAIVSGYYSVVLPNKEFFAVSVNWENPEGASGIHHFIQPYGTNAGVGVTSIICPFEWDIA